MKICNINVELHQMIVEYAEQLYAIGKYEESAELITSLAKFETQEYIGYLSSIRLEHLLLSMSRTLFPSSNYKKKERTQRTVLHVATEFYNIGGHTRVVLDWIKNDTNSNSEVLLIDQNVEVDLLGDIKVNFLAKGNLIEKSKALRSFLEQNYFDVIVLHQHTEDVRTTLAWGDLKEQVDSLILFYNHANFRFSLGNIIANKRVNITEGDLRISLQYGYPLEECVLPFVLGDELPEQIAAPVVEERKKELNLEGKIVFLTIGSAYKYTPFEEHNFFAEWNLFLSKHPNCVLLAIGCTRENFNSFCPNVVAAENLRLLGNILAPAEYYQIADYIVDIYPLPTGLGMLQGIYWNLAPILPYGENVTVIGKEIKELYPTELKDLLKYKTKAEYFNFIEHELKTRAYQPKARAILKRFVSDNLLAAPWRETLEEIYTKAPKPIEAFDKTKDILNLSTPSETWYKYTDSPTRRFNLIVLAFQYNIPLSFKLLRMYVQLILQHKKLKGAGLKTFFNYLLGRYKTGT